MSCKRFRRILPAALLLWAASLCGAQQPAVIPGLNPALPLTHVDNGRNSAAAERAHYVVLVSLDGFRWDYAVREGAKNLLALGRAGVWAPEGMLPSFPSLTFPNHYTLVTGLYPEHHGIVANGFYDEALQARFGFSDSAADKSLDWFGGEPLWSLAESQGMRTACLFWVGSEARIAGYRPSYYATFNARTASTEAVEQARIDNLTALLKLPAAERPHLITIYYAEPDHQGHLYGPDAPETRAAALHADEQVGRIRAALAATGLPVDLVVVSDHGMVKTEGDWITLDSFADLKGFETAGMLLYGKTEADRARLYGQLRGASDKFRVYRRAELPAELHYNENPRTGDPVVIPTGPYSIRARAGGGRQGRADMPPSVGAHGYNPYAMPEMKASFFAAGPDIAPGRTVKPFENVNLYPWLAQLLGLKAPKTDGDPRVLSSTLRKGAGK